MMMSKILLACTLLAINGRRVKKHSDTLQSEQDQKVSGPKTHALLPLLMAFNTRPSDAFAMGPGTLRREASRPAISPGAAYHKPLAPAWAGTVAAVAVDSNWYPLDEHVEIEVPLAKKAMAPAKVVPARAGPGPKMQDGLFVPAPDEDVLEGFPRQSSRTADDSNGVMGSDATPPPLPSAGDPEILQAANSFVYTANGFYSPPREDAFADDFIFRGPVVGPLNKRDYLDTLGTFAVYKAFPDLSPNAFGFTVDPENPLRVWFLVRNMGTNTGPFNFGFGLSYPPSGNAVRGNVETFSVTFDEARKVKLLTIGYVADRFDEQATSGGKGAVVGLLNGIGLGPVASLTGNPFVQRLANAIAPEGGARTVSKPEDMPAWWPFEERGGEGA